MSKPSSRKTFDIIPPERIEEKSLPKIEFGEKEPREKEVFRPKIRKTPLKIISLVIILILGGIISYFIFQRAEIIVWPKTQQVNFQEKVTVDLNAKQSDFSTNTVPGVILEEEQRTSQDFSSSGKTLKEKKAEGIIQVYNAYSTSSQVLVATTRFVSADGKLFRSIERATIPGGHYDKGKLVPGVFDVKVQADQPGQDYNIEPSTFSIPGFAGTPRYTAFYGKSFEPMKGGFKGEAAQVTQGDLEEAEKALKEKLLESAKISLKNKVSEQVVVLEEASEKEFSSLVLSAKAGEEKNSFVGEGQLSFKALTFKKSDLENFVIEYIISQISKDQKLDLNSLKISYSPEIVKLNEGKMILALDFSAKIYFDILDKGLKDDLAGKELPEAKELLSKDPRISKSEISLWPFWMGKIPSSIKKIKIEQRIDPDT